MTFHTMASAIVGSTKKWKRKPADFYPTPADVTLALLKHLQIPAGARVKEPACGTGEMSVVLEHMGLCVDSSDLRNTGFGRGGVDYLTSPVARPCDWVISNPPFKLALQFIARSLQITPNVAMLLKSQFWHAASRTGFFYEHRPAEVLALTWRPSFLEKERGKSPLMDVIWVVWKDGCHARTYDLLARPAKSELVGLRKPLLRPVDDDLFGQTLRRRFIADLADLM